MNLLRDFSFFKSINLSIIPYNSYLLTSFFCFGVSWLKTVGEKFLEEWLNNIWIDSRFIISSVNKICNSSHLKIKNKRDHIFNYYNVVSVTSHIFHPISFISHFMTSSNDIKVLEVKEEKTNSIFSSTSTFSKHK